VTEGAPKLETPTVEMFDFKAKFAETKASAKVRSFAVGNKDNESVK
jgi:hypothetical protein